MTMHRPADFDMSAVRLALQVRAAEVALALLGEPNRAMSTRRQWRFGRKGSLALDIAGPKAGCWYDHEIGVGGDLIDLIHRERGGEFLDAVRYAENFIGSMPVRPVSAPRAFAADKDDPISNRDRALQLWCEAEPIACTIAASYLARRKVLDIACTIDGTVLRFHPSCPFAENTRRPCLITLMRDVITNEPKAIQRTALTVHGEKIGRRTLGSKTGAAIKITADEDVATGLAVGEGLETILSAMMRGFTPAWALGDTGNLGAFPILSGIEALTIIVDNDANEAGQAAALKCSRRWTAAGCEVRRVIPKRVGADFNDLAGVCMRIDLR
jgi:putative DNA primase/helicase